MRGKDSPAPQTTSQSLCKKTGSGQAGRQTGKDCRALENGKLPGLRNQLVTFDQPEPRHQLLWDNRQPSEAWRAAGTLGTTGQWPPGEGLVNKAHRAKSRQYPSMKCCMKAAKWTAAQRSHCFCPVDSAQWHSHKPDILSADRLVVEVQLYATLFTHTPCLCIPTCTEKMLTHLSLWFCGKQKAAVNKAAFAAQWCNTQETCSTARLLPITPSYS